MAHPIIVSHAYRKKIISNQFRLAIGTDLNLRHPNSLNEKIQWLKLYYRNPNLTRCADKHQVRKYVSSVIGEKYLIKEIGTYKNANEIDFSKLPRSFVLKANNGSGTNIICRDKSKLDIEKTKKTLSDWMLPTASHYWYSFEWCYKNVKPLIICEEYIGGLDDLKDYKFLCYNGKVQNLFVCSERMTGKLKVDFFDREWNHLSFERVYKNARLTPEKPQTYSKMIEIAEMLAKSFPFVRVDLYEKQNKVMFGELTFYPGNGVEGFTPKKADYNLGRLLILPQKSPLYWLPALYPNAFALKKLPRLIIGKAYRLTRTLIKKTFFTQWNLVTEDSE